MEREQDWIYPAMAIALGAAICAAYLKLVTGYPGMPNGLTSFRAAIAILLMAALFRFLRYLFVLWRAGEDHPISQISAQFWLALRGFGPIVIGVAIISAFLLSVTLLKSMIPAVVPFWADAQFAAIDRALLIRPQAIAVALKPALGAIGLFYGLWHAAHLGGILWVLHWRRPNKGRHILSFMLTWAIGMTCAFIFSSAGPLFTGQFDPSVAPESVQKAATYLWSNYNAEAGVIGGGISAFPSMHVAIAAWLAIVLRDRGLPLFGLAYLIGVFACSVILGWHYVADGIAGMAIALLADMLSRAWFARRETPQGAAVPAVAG